MHDPLPRVHVARLRLALAAHGLTITGLARACGCSPQHLTYVLLGGRAGSARRRAARRGGGAGAARLRAALWASVPPDAWAYAVGDTDRIVPGGRGRA